MTENVDDSTEGGYTAHPSIPAEELEKLRVLRAEYIITDSRMIDQLDAAYVEALIEKYGDVAELATTTVEDDPDAPDYSDIDPEFYGYHPE